MNAVVSESQMPGHTRKGDRKNKKVAYPKPMEKKKKDLHKYYDNAKIYEPINK